MTFRSEPNRDDFRPMFHARGRMSSALRRVRAQSVGYLRPGYPRVLDDYSFLFPPADIVDLAAVRAERSGQPVAQPRELPEPAVSTTQMVGLLTRLLRSLKR